MQLIWEKFAQPQFTTLLRRPRLLQELQSNLTRYAATVLSGRAGTGKTWLAADFAKSCPYRTAWYKVDASDSSLSVFLEYLAATVLPSTGRAEGLLRECCRAAVPLLNPAAYAEVMAHIAEHAEQPLLIVLDDLHLIYDAPWFGPFLSRLLPLLPRTTHLLLVGRGVPPAPLWRLRSKQSLGMIEETALAFTLEESKELLAHLDLSEAETVAAWRQTHGRAALLTAAPKPGYGLVCASRLEN